MRLQPKPVLTLLFFLCSFGAASLHAEEPRDEEVVEEAGITDYIAMDPPFVTHVGMPGNKVTYLKASVSLRVASTGARPAVEAHMPRLRHELVMLFGEQTDVDQLTATAGQQALRDEAKTRINQVLEEQQTGESITGVLFTEFVVQK
ncbi:flagellar basal body-associated FliL family protein [Marinobacter sp. M216]|uniref:Flagellar protein FliL n=1 Tax=Marinobacter albus TaxID=3030833 RepID=A0ABT7HEJ4_9GAMM|nr:MULTISPECIES: flagellar basal body-associated FliL family protein [unclassified Marinobacter]MBW7472218.1 flagellar basal body-associated FliL family protein [Marinobacter sp. F4218]MDK9558788.1 flagellar basal body-associated FliL family protein [Marinobacter sp. M216]